MCIRDRAKKSAIGIGIGYRDVDGANVTAKQELIAKMVGATASAGRDGTQNHAQTEKVCRGRPNFTCVVLQ